MTFDQNFLMKRLVFPSLLILMSGIFAVPVNAYVGLCCGKCGGNMPMNIPGGGVPETHEFRFKLSPMFMRMEGLDDGGNHVRRKDLLGMPLMMGNPTGKFMAVPENMDMGMLNLAAGYSFTDDFFAGLMLMVQSKRMDMRFNSMMAASTGQDGYTMDSEGMADTMLMAKYRLYTDDPLIPRRQVSLFMGLSLPSGSIDEKNDNHPLAMRRGELLPYSMQLGSGTFDPTLGLLYQGSLSPWWWGTNAMYTHRFYNNSRDYRRGNELRLDLYGMYQFRYDMLAQLQLGGQHSGNIHGEMDAAVDGAAGRVTQGEPASPYMSPLWNPENYGGDKLLLSLGLQWQPASLHILDLTLGLPLYQNLNGPQLEESYRVMLTWYRELPTAASIRFRGKTTNGHSSLGF